MSSNKAMQVAGQYAEECKHIPWDKEGVEQKKLATLIDTALAQARLEGAKAMQEKASGLGKHMVNLLPVGIPDVDSPLYKIAQNNITTYSKLITNLDPQQVINESMGK
jgi:hypothetical protein